MKITSAKVETVYHIEYTFEDFIEAAHDDDWRIARPQAFMVGGIDILDMSEEKQIKIFRSTINSLHGDTYDVIARHFGFDGWKHAGLYNERKDLRTITVYREGDDL